MSYNLAIYSFSKESPNIATEEYMALGIYFKPDGSKMYLTGQGSVEVHQYSLSINWDVSTASYDSISYDMYSDTRDPRGLSFKSDGTKMYISDNTNSKILQYSLSSAWDLSTISYELFFDVSGQGSSITDHYFKSDGTKLYVCDYDIAEVHQYSLSTPWDISTTSSDNKILDVSSESDMMMGGIFFEPDGLTFYGSARSVPIIYQYTLTLAWDISTASYNSSSLNLSSQQNVTSGLYINSDGLIISLDSGYNKVVSWSPPPPTLVSPPEFISTVSISIGGIIGGDITVSPEFSAISTFDILNIIGTIVVVPPTFISTSVFSDYINGIIIEKWIPPEAGIQFIRNGLGIDSILITNNPIKDIQYHLLKLQYGMYAEAIQAILNEVKGKMEGVTSANVEVIRSALIRGNENLSFLIIKNSLPEYITEVQKLLQLIAEGISDIEVIKNALIRGDENLSSLIIRNSLPEYSTGTQKLLQLIADSNISIEILKNALIRGDENLSSLIIKNSLPEYLIGVQKLLQLIADGSSSIEVIRNILSDTEISAIQTILNVFDAVDYTSSHLFIKQSLKDLSAIVHSSTTKVYLDNVQIDNTIGQNIEISFNQDNIHNEITISSISQQLFDWADPSVNSGTPRIEVQVGSRVLYFLLERREGSGSDFTLWGRDQTARDSFPWSLSDNIYLNAPELASSVAASVTNYSAVDWDTDLFDFMLPETFEAEGTPTEILNSIVQEIGGIVRAQDDGSLLLRKKYTVRPINMPSSIANITYLANQVVDFNHSKIIGDHYNKVSVVSGSPDSILAQIEIEELPNDDTRYVGRTSFVRAYFITPNLNITNYYSTDGSITLVSLSPTQETYEEIVEFKEGVAETFYPIYNLDLSVDSNGNLINVEWIGDSGNIIDWNQYEKTITLDDLTHFRLAKITYTIQYYKYELSNHSVDELLAVFFYTDNPTLNVTVVTSQLAKDENGNLIDKIGDSILTDNLPTSSGAAAVERGTAWIDDNKYDSYEHSFISPYNDLAKDGSIAWIDCSRIGSAGNYYIANVGITISGAKVTNTLGVKQWQV